MGRERRPVIWVEEAAGFEIRGGIVFYSMPPGTDYDVCSTPAVLLDSIRRATAVYNDFARQSGGRIVRLRRRRTIEPIDGGG